MCVMYHPDKHLGSKNKQVIKFILVLAQVVFRPYISSVIHSVAIADKRWN